jgi:hypothetical protein
MLINNPKRCYSRCFLCGLSNDAWSFWAFLLGEIHAGMHKDLINNYKLLGGHPPRGGSMGRPIPLGGIGEGVIRFYKGGYIKGGNTSWQE